MKLLHSFLIASSLVPFVQADLLASAIAVLPECAIDCLVSAISSTSCSITDTACIGSHTEINTQSEECVRETCTIKEALITKNFTVSASGSPSRDRTKQVSIIGVTGGALALLAVGLRVFARLPCLGGQWGNDDWAILVAMLPVIPLTCFSVVLANDGLGKDIWTVPFDKITYILHIYYFDESLYLLSIALTKISIIFFYLRIFPDKKFRKLAYGMMACCILYILGFVPPVIFQCKPLNLSWKKWDGEHSGRCINLHIAGWISSAVNIVLDVLIILLPLNQLAQLKLSRRKKYGLMLMFTLGLFVTVISMLRLKWMIQFANSENVTWDYVPIGYWSTIEVHVGIICACLPAFRALQFRLFPSTAHASQYANNYYNASKPSGFNTQASNVSIIRSTATKGESHKDKKDAREFVPLDDLSAKSVNVVVAGKGERKRGSGGGEGISRITVRKEYSVAVEEGRGTFYKG